MRVIVADGDFNPVGYLENYESFVWTDRYNTLGDFQMVLPASAKFNGSLIASSFQLGQYLLIDDSDQFMVVESVSIASDGEGVKKVTLSGRSGVAILDIRVMLIDSSADGGYHSSNQKGSDAAIRLTELSCSINRNDFTTQNIIPGLVYSNTATDDLLPEIQEPTNTLVQAILNVAQLGTFGFKMVYSLASPVFTCYSGTDRSVNQSTVDPVVFDVNLDSLVDASYFDTISNIKNVCYVWFNKSGNPQERDYRSYWFTGGAEPSGYNRRETWVDATDLDTDAYTSTVFMNLLQYRARKKLEEQNLPAIVDGVIRQDPTKLGAFVYGVDYFLGDVVTFRGEYGYSADMQITEYIWAVDGEGSREYPTLVAKES